MILPMPVRLPAYTCGANFNPSKVKLSFRTISLQRLQRSILILAWMSACIAGYAADAPTGFASVSALGMETTTGGAAGETVHVYTYADLKQYATAAAPYTLLIHGSIVQEKFTQLSVKSNKTLVGVGDSATLTNIELHLINVHNIIIRNLTIKEVGWAELGDGDGLQADNCHHLWIDHCHFSHNFDGCVDLRYNCDYITISWTRFSNHNKTLGIGWTDETNFRKTIHHCWFDQTMRRNASLGAGINHVYNVYLKDVSAWGMKGRGNSINIIENSFFENTSSPIGVEENALLYTSGNVFKNSNGSNGNVEERPFSPETFYAYTPDTTMQVTTVVSTGAGPQAFVSNQYTGNLNQNYTVTAAAANEFGSVSSVSITAAEGERVHVRAIPNEGYQFDYWNIEPFGAANPATLILTRDMHLVAHFKVAQYTVNTHVAGGGTISPANPIREVGQQASLLASPNAGWIFEGWSGDVSGTENPVQIHVTRELNVTAHFRQLWASVSAMPVGGGTVHPELTTYTIDSTATLLATPSKSWVFDHWEGDLSGNQNPVSFPVKQDMEIRAVFKQILCNVTTRVVKGEGSVTPQNQNFNNGEEVTITAIPEPGWVFDKWVGYTPETTNPIVITLDADLKLSAFFKLGPTATPHTQKDKSMVSTRYNRQARMLEVELPNNQPCTLTLFTMDGKAVLQRRLGGTRHAQLKLTTLPAGVYVVWTEHENRRQSSLILIPE